MTIQIDSPYDFAIVSAGTRFPNVLMRSGEGSLDLAGHYALRELGLDADRSANYTSPFSMLTRAKADFSTEVWSVDAWDDPDHIPTVIKNRKRRQKVALVVRGLPNPQRAGLRGAEIYDALQRHLDILVKAIDNDDKESIDFNVSVLSALLGRVDQMKTRIDNRRELLRSALVLYVGVVILFVSILAIFYPQLFDGPINP